MNFRQIGYIDMFKLGPDMDQKSCRDETALQLFANPSTLVDVIKISSNIYDIRAIRVARAKVNEE